MRSNMKWVDAWSGKMLEVIGEMVEKGEYNIEKVFTETVKKKVASELTEEFGIEFTPTNVYYHWRTWKAAWGNIKKAMNESEAEWDGKYKRIIMDSRTVQRLDKEVAKWINRPILWLDKLQLIYGSLPVAGMTKSARPASMDPTVQLVSHAKPDVSPVSPAEPIDLDDQRHSPDYRSPTPNMPEDVTSGPDDMSTSTRPAEAFATISKGKRRRIPEAEVSNVMLCLQYIHETLQKHTASEEAQAQGSATGRSMTERFGPLFDNILEMRGFEYDDLVLVVDYLSRRENIDTTELLSHCDKRFRTSWIKNFLLDRGRI